MILFAMVLTQLHIFRNEAIIKGVGYRVVELP